MRGNFLRRTSMLALIASGLFCGDYALCQTNVTFVPTGPANWNDGSSWNPSFVPQSDFNEIAVIDGDRSAFVKDTPTSVSGIVISAGTLEIQSGGNLSAVASELAAGDLVVGQAGAGKLIVRRGGTLTAQNLTTGGSLSSELTLGETGGTGTASLSISSGTLSRVTTVTGPNVDFSSSGNLTFASSGTLRPVITGLSHSAIDVTGRATLGGVVQPAFSGHTPALGNSWDLVTAGSIQGRFTVDDSQSPAAPRGAAYVMTQTDTTATLRYMNKLILSVDRGTGATSIQNAIGSPIAFDGYTITSPSGALDGAWNSLDDQGISAWEEADNADGARRTEFNPSATSSVSAGASLSLGTPFSPEPPSKFGEAIGEDLSFEYAVPGLGTIDGFVEFVGARNNVVLTIDPSNGRATIQNQSPYFDVVIDGYTIQSASGRLKTANGNWNSLADQNLGSWEEADNVSSTRLTEFSPTSETEMAGGGMILDLGSPIDIAGEINLDDFTFDVAIFQPLGGDYNDDGSIDAADYTVWRDNLGSGVSLPNDDTPGVGQDDYIRWKTNFGNTGGSSTVRGIVAFGSIAGAASLALSGASAVPEPSTMIGVVFLAAIVAASRLPLSRARVCGER